MAPAPADRDPALRVRISALVLGLVIVAGTVAYILLGLTPLDALYQTVTTISTVGFREYGETDVAWKITTLVVILVGVGAALYTLGVFLETLVEGRLTDRLDQRRMTRRIATMEGHVIVCGWGRVGRTVAAHLQGTATEVVVIDNDPARVAMVEGPVIEGDATDDDVLRQAGIERAATLVAASSTDADNLYITLSARALRPDLFIVARARLEMAEPKLEQAGANRVVNPQKIGGARMAALATQPAVADFLDVVMHDGSLEFRLGEVPLRPGSALVGRTLRDAQIRERTGAMILAVQDAGQFLTNPAPETVLRAEQLLIAIGTEVQLKALADEAVPDEPPHEVLEGQIPHDR
jgi:voltage-gated potassium channel